MRTTAKTRKTPETIAELGVLLEDVAKQVSAVADGVLGNSERIDKLDERADKGLFLGKATNTLQRYHERVMVEKHLARLMERDFAMARQDGRFQKLG